MATTLYRLAEECLKLLNGGDIQTATNVSFGEVKVSICQIANSLLKVEHFSVNEKLGEKIDNGGMLALYEGLDVVSTGGKSIVTLPIKPIKLPRNMGLFGVYPKYTLLGNYEYDKEWIPLQMGQAGLLKSQPLLNDLMGQVGYENFGLSIVATKDVKSFFPDVKVAVRLAIMDLSQYDDYSIFPVLPEQEWQIKQEIVKLYGGEGISDKVVDVTTAQQQNVPLNKQRQS